MAAADRRDLRRDEFEGERRQLEGDAEALRLPQAQLSVHQGHEEAAGRHAVLHQGLPAHRGPSRGPDGDGGAAARVTEVSLNNQPKNLIVSINILSDEKYHLKIEGNPAIERDLLFGEHFSEAGFNFSILTRDTKRPISEVDSYNSYYFYFSDVAGLASSYMNKLIVFAPNSQSTMLTLSVSGSVLQQEIDYLNKLMEVYIRQGLDNKNLAADSTMNFIRRQLTILSDSLGKAEDDLEYFRTNNKFIDLSTDGARIQTKVEAVDNEKTAFELQLQYFRYLEEYLNSKNQSGTIISPSVMGITDGLLMSLIEELTEYQKEINKMGMNFSGESPATALILKQMEEARSALMENVKNNIDNLKDLIERTDKKVASIESELDKLPSLERKLINIQRKFDLNNSIYTTLLEKNSESAIKKASNTSDNRIIDQASGYSAAQIKPTTQKNMVTAIMLGLIIPATIILLVSLLDDKIKDKKDIEKKTRVPIIGFIGHSESGSDIPVARKPGSSLAESFRSVRTTLKYFIKENDTTVIAVSSTISGEGKTFFSVNLAAMVGMLGKKVLLIGLDLRKPRMDKVFDFGNDKGMSTYLSGNSSYEEIIKETEIKNLYYVPAGPRPPNPAELIEGNLMKEFLSRAKQEYDFILIDTPPVGLVTDGLLLAKIVDINIFIVRQRYTSKNSLDMMEQLRQQGELKNIAIVMNDISLSGYYGYGMRYNYYNSYGYHYGNTYYGSRYYGGYGYGYGRKKRKKNAKDYYTED